MKGYTNTALDELREKITRRKIYKNEARRVHGTEGWEGGRERGGEGEGCTVTDACMFRERGRIRKEMIKKARLMIE